MFEKNLELIDNIGLKRRLQKISSIESRIGISYCVTNSGDYILLKDDVPIDDLNNPREAVSKIIQNTIKNEMKNNDFIITFGIGLGYLLDEAFNRYPCKIYVYEPDINLLHFVLNNVDISEHLASGRIYITNDLGELVNKLSSTFLTKDKVEIVYLPNYAILKNKELLVLTQKVYDTCKSKMMDVSTIAKFSRQWLINALNNFGAIKSKPRYLLSDLENKFIGQTALIAAAGPSLKENIQHIKANRDKLVIFAVNKIAKYLLENDIIPDFIVCLDALNMDKTLNDIGSRLEKTNCIMDARADYRLNNFAFKKIFYSFSDTDFLITKLAKSNNNIKFYESGGTAASLALTSAVKMGFTKIIAAGLDLAFKDNEIYSSGEKMNRISQQEIVVDSIRKNIIQVKSVNGNMVYTRDDYATFLNHFEVLIKELNFKGLYNVSSFGAKIEGFINQPFEQIHITTSSNLSPLNFIEPCNLVFQDFMQEEFKEINNIISMLSKGVFSSALVSSIVKSVMIYQYMQAEVLNVLQKNFDPELAKNFIEQTKLAIKTIVELLQKNKLI